MLKWLAIGLGGGLGSIARYAIGHTVHNHWLKTSLFPFGTLIVNLSGCLLIGLLAGWIETKHSFSKEWQLFLMVGMLGGYTTFSTFGFESWELLKSAQFIYFITNLITQVCGGIILGWVGFYLSQRLFLN